MNRSAAVVANHETDVLIIGSGLAALTVALSVAPTRRVAIVTKRSLLDGASAWAQGGIAAVLDGNTAQIESHIADTLIAGAGLCRPAAVRHIITHAASAVNWLVEQGVVFEPDAAHPSGYHLTREGGHSERRILHVRDATGKAVQSALAAQVMAHPNIRIFDQHFAIDLITGRKLGGTDPAVKGAYVFDVARQVVETFAAPRVVLATGGAGKVYLYTSNPDTATGDGVAMAWRAGCRVANMEFVQFHPTCLYHPQAKSFLISEAVRGEGGRLCLPDGTPFMAWHDERADLAPRDVVARAIDLEMKKRGLDCVYLDITHKPARFIREHFPNIYARCLELGIDITHDPIPVVPATHYSCGGVATGLDGASDIPGLYVVGETGCTGLHGANRLASNSLLECLVIGRNAARAICLATDEPLPSKLPAWDASQVTRAEEEVTISHNWDELRRVMWNYVGIVRSDTRLRQALTRIHLLSDEVQSFYARYTINTDLLELRNLVTVADLIVRSALHRKESRGLHTTRDYPGQMDQAVDTVLVNSMTEPLV